jgi:uncharacterized phiE125 gp8 family phage protein
MSYEPILVTALASTEEPISIEEAKLWLKVDEDQVEDDPVIQSLIATARERWERRTKRSTIIQTFDQYLDAFPDSCPIRLGRAPLVSVTSVRSFSLTELTDSGGTTMSSSGYYVDTAHEPGHVVPMWIWPVATREVNGGIVRFKAGYSSGTSGVPEAAKSEIKQLLATLYEHRGDEAEQQAALYAFDCELGIFDLPEWG